MPFLPITVAAQRPDGMAWPSATQPDAATSRGRQADRRRGRTEDSSAATPPRPASAAPEKRRNVNRDHRSDRKAGRADRAGRRAVVSREASGLATTAGAAGRKDLIVLTQSSKKGEKTTTGRLRLPYHLRSWQKKKGKKTALPDADVCLSNPTSRAAATFSA